MIKHQHTLDFITGKLHYTTIPTVYLMAFLARELLQTLKIWDLGERKHRLIVQPVKKIILWNISIVNNFKC